MNRSCPGGGFSTFISSWRVDQNQAIRASIGATRELILKSRACANLSQWYPFVKRIPLAWAGEVRVQ